MKKFYITTLSLFLISFIGIALAFADAGHEDSRDRIEELITQPLTLPLVVTALVVSFVLGGLHALTPGHGKAVVAAYLVGSKGRIIDAVLLGIIVTFTHTFSVIGLGIILLLAKDYLVSENIVPWLSLFSGALIVLIGGWLLTKNMKRYYTGIGHPHTHHAPDDHSHSDAHAHDHVHHSPASERPSFLGLLLLGISGGIVPCIDSLVGLLLAINLDRLEWGLVILSAFSLGLAAALVAIGILMVLAKPLIERFTGEGIWLKRLPIFSAVVVILLGALLVFKAFNDIGIWI